MAVKVIKVLEETDYGRTLLLECGHTIIVGWGVSDSGIESDQCMECNCNAHGEDEVCFFCEDKPIK